jgi:hypothetical protein
MSNKRFWWSVAAVWIVMAVSSWVLHGMWLMPLYKSTAQFWRSDSEMASWMWVMWLGWAAFAWAFVWIWSKGLSQANVWWQAWRYAWAVIAVAEIPHMAMTWAVSPYPWELVAKMFLVSAVQALMCSFVMTWTYKPAMGWQGQKVKAS